MELKAIKRKGQVEETIWRFPHLVEKIFQKLDVQSLRKSEEVNKIWQKFIFESKILSIKLLKKYTQIPIAVLKKKLQKQDFQTVQKLANFARITFSRIVFAEFKSKRQLLDDMLYNLLIKEPELQTKTKYLLSELLIQHYDCLYNNCRQVLCENMILKAISNTIKRKDIRQVTLVCNKHK